MNRNKKVAWLLICMMFIQLIPMQVFANNQSFVPPPQLMDDGISHKIDLNNPLKMTPSIGLRWAKPPILPVSPNPGPGADKEDPVSAYQIELYDFGTKNGTLSEYIRDTGDSVSKRLDSIGFGYNAYGSLVDKRYMIENGTFYKASVHARHFHSVPVPGSTVDEHQLAPYEPGAPNPLYFITDFNPKLNDTPEGLELEWEYIPGADYTIYYVAADKTTKEQILDKKDIPYSKILIKDEEAKKHLYPADSKSRIRYTLEDLKPKQIYSMFVEVTGFSNDPSGQGIDKIEQNKYTDARGPKVVQGIPGIDIDVYNVGKDEIEIYWGQISWAVIGGKLEGIKVYAREEGKEQHLVAEKMVSNTEDLVSIILDKPADNTYYQVGFIIKGKEILSREKLYVPPDLRVQPLNPKVPKAYGKNLDISQTKNEYLVTGDTIPLEDPNFIQNTFHGKVDKGTTIQLVWDAPKKQDKKYDNEIDHELYYDIWVSDTLEPLEVNSKLEPIASDLQINESNKEGLITRYQNENEVIGMKTQLTHYTNSQGQRVPLRSNQTYYIKIIAKRMYGNQSMKSQNTIVSINLDKNGNISVPPVIGKPPLRIKENGITQTEVTLEWRTLWYEILAKNLELYAEDEDEKVLAEIGSTRVYTPTVAITTGPAIHFKYKEGWKEHTLLTSDDVKDVRTQITTSVFDKDYYSRKVTLEDDVQYELKVLPYDEVEKLLAGKQSIENWVATTQGDNEENWKAIDPKEGDQDDRGLRWKEYTVDSLKPNTRYIMMLRAYRITNEGEKLMQTFPSYIIATTLTDFIGPEPVPTVPTLQLDSYTDTSISVYWKYNKDFDYELVYSRKDNPDEAAVWEFSISDDPTKDNYVPNGEKAVVTIGGLFPQTTYNVWIRAKQKKGDKISAWSNPVTVKTKDIKAPDVPTGLGPASAQSLLEIDKDFKPVGPDYITVEWTKDLNDTGVQTEGNMQKYYEYDLEFADNVEFLDSIVVNVTDALGTGKKYEILAKNIVKFNDLIANRPYYVRIKARLVLKDTQSERTISKESEYSKWVRIYSKTSEGEYDGGENDNIITYPDAIIQDYDRGEWTLEIVDAQKIISDIKTSHDYFYTIRMEKYKNRYDAHLRHIKIPVSVIQALITSRMELKIITETAIYEVPAQTMSYYINKAGASDKVQIDLEEVLAYDIKHIAKPFPYAVETAEKMSISLRSKSVTRTPMKRFDGNIKVALKLENSTDYKTNTLKTYTYDYSYGDWISNPHVIDTREDGTYSVYSTPSLGIYTLYKIITYTDYRNTNYAMDQLLGTYNIEKLGTKYTKDEAVYSDQFINLLLGIAQGHVDIDMDAPASQNKKKAKDSMLYIEDAPGYITQEQAIHGVIRLYEMKTGNRVKASTRTVSNVSPLYKESVSKAYALGLVDNISPKAQVTYGKLIELIQLVLP